MDDNLVNDKLKWFAMFWLNCFRKTRMLEIYVLVMIFTSNLSKKEDRISACPSTRLSPAQRLLIRSNSPKLRSTYFYATDHKGSTLIGQARIINPNVVVHIPGSYGTLKRRSKQKLPFGGYPNSSSLV